MIKKPSKFWLYTDGLRAFLEFIVFCFFRLFYKYKKDGDGHPVLVIPGFLGQWGVNQANAEVYQ